MTDPNSATAASIPNYHFDNLKKIEDGYWWFEGRLIWAKALIDDWKAKRKNSDPVTYADLGCGTGGFGLEIQKLYNIENALLVDSSPDAMAKITSQNKATLLAIDMEKNFSLPFQPNFISCMDVIEHLRDDVAFLTRLAAQLKPGGLLVLSVPAHPFLYSAWDTQLGHYRRYSAKELRKKITAAGLKVNRVTYGWCFLFPAAPYRWLTPAKQSKLEYPAVPRWMNILLVMGARWESFLSQWISFPFGTSVFLSATKE